MTEAEKQVADAVKELKKRLGWAAWAMLGPELRQKLVRAEVLSVIGKLAAFEDTYCGKLATAALRWNEENAP